MNDLGTGLCRSRLLAIVAAVALIGCTAVFSAHGLGERSHENSHCDLCLHFSGSAGSLSQPKIVGKPVLVTRAAPPPTEIIQPTRSPVGAHLPRGPPAIALI